MNEDTQISVLTNEINEFKNNLTFDVVDEKSFALATDTLKALKIKIKQTDDARKTLTKPLSDHVKMITSKFAPILETLDSYKVELDKKMCNYLANERIKKIAEEKERLRLEAEILRKKAADENVFASWTNDSKEKETHEVNSLIAKTQANRIERQDVVIDDKKLCVAGNFATSSVRKSWVYEVIDEALIPRNYLTYDDAAIKLAIKGGARAINGIRIFEKETIVSR